MEKEHYIKRKNSIVLRVPAEFNETINKYIEYEKVKMGINDIPKATLMRKFAREFEVMQAKLKDADIIIKKSKIRFR